MSDLLPHTRSDLAELPCDTEPAATVATSDYLNRPLRSIAQVLRDVSKYRDLPMSYLELIRPRTNVLPFRLRGLG